MFTSRNYFPMAGFIDDSNDIDTVYETCDQEFNSRSDVHCSFQNSENKKDWARLYLFHEVQKICTRDRINLTQAAQFMIATRLAQDWYLSQKREEQISETKSSS